MRVGGVKDDFTCLVVRDLTQECIIGADFLTKHCCVIDLQNKTLRAGGESTTFCNLGDSSQESKAICHVFFPQTTVLPGQTEVELSLSLSTSTNHGTALFEPANSFVEKYGDLLAHALTITGTGKTRVRMLNPSSAPVTIYQNERVGELYPTTTYIPESLCTIQQTKPGQLQRDPAMVRKVVEQLLPDSPDVGQADTDRLRTLLNEFSDIISVDASDLGQTTLVQHEINTGDATPIRQPPRRLPFHQRRDVQELVSDMLERGVVELSNGPWSSPIVLVKKKDGTTRFCMDFRKVNDLTKKDAHPLPRIDDTLDALGGAQWFTTLDLASGYWQVEVNPADRKKTAFATPDGLYQFRVMPFGLRNAPSTFQRLMERVLQGLHWSSCLVYLDDIIIYSRTIGKHLTRLAEVFLRLREAKLKIKPSKCHLLRKSIHYLGHVVSRNGVETDPTKIKFIVQWPAPSNTKELKQFLGMCSYYRRFVRSFAKNSCSTTSSIRKRNCMALDR